MGSPNNMTVVKSVEAFMCAGNVARISKPKRELVYREPGTKAVSNKSVTYEVVHGRCFTNGDGDICMIGLSEEASEVLGLPFEAIERLEEDLRDKNRVINKYDAHCYKQDVLRETLNDKVDELVHEVIATRGLHENVSAWRRLKFLFTGNL